MDDIIGYANNIIDLAEEWKGGPALPSEIGNDNVQDRLHNAIMILAARWIDSVGRADAQEITDNN